MRSRPLTLMVLGFALQIVALPAMAHHSWSLEASLLTLKGTVAGYEWANPHVTIYLNVKNDNGVMAKWTVDGPSLNRMASYGWSKNTVKAGDVIFVIGYKAKDRDNTLRVERAIVSDGRQLLAYGR